MKAKYVEEKFPRWFIFGEFPGTPYVDVSDGEKDVFTKIGRWDARELIRVRNEFVDGMISLLAK